MKAPIQWESVAANDGVTKAAGLVEANGLVEAAGYTRKTLLPLEIEGVTVSYTAVGPGNNHGGEPVSGQSRVMIFIRGSGMVDAARHRFSIGELALLCPPLNAAYTVQADGSGLGYLEILMELAPEEQLRRDEINRRLPYFLSYSGCELYREGIKSEKTINRTLLPVSVLPRVTIGSVQTAGPDQVGAHRHPMLEQLFYGLAGNHCLVTADETEAPFEEDVLLHIPLGSNHGVRVEKGSALHYLWMDFFHSEQDMSYISDTHVSVEGKEPEST